MKYSLVGEFNRAQTEKGRLTCGSTAALDWLKKHRPKVAIHPSMTDYCDTCKFIKEQQSRNQAILNRSRQSGSSSEEDIRNLESKKKDLDDELSAHREAATKSRDEYKRVIEKSKKEWDEIMKLTNLDRVLTPSERDRLTMLKHCFTLTISADYQQSKLIPYWGRSEQPGSTYYLQKVSHDIFGIVNHSQGSSSIYVFDERIGPKNTDHTISLLDLYWHHFSQKYPWVKRFAIYLDNATSTNKNKYLFGWAMELVRNRKVDHLHICFMIAGHTKFAPDRLFSIVGSAYKCADVFNMDDLKQICEQGATTFIEDGSSVCTWRDLLGEKYTSLPGVRKLHDFLVVRLYDGNVVMKVRDHIYTGGWKNSPLTLCNPSLPTAPTDTYDHRTRTITKEKMANMVTMYDKFIPPQFRPDYLPPPTDSSRT